MEIRKVELDTDVENFIETEQDLQIVKAIEIAEGQIKALTYDSSEE